MEKKLIIIFLIFFFAFKAFSQKKEEFALYNIGLGGFVGGIGAIINKDSNEKTGKVFLKGFWQGALGGYLIYESKNIITKVNTEQSWGYSWLAKGVNSAGVSIVENASSNRDFWEQWNLNIGFNRFEFHTKEEFKFKYRIMPVSLGLTISVAVGNKFEIERSLQTGEVIFSSSKVRVLENGNISRGSARGNAILLNNQFINDYRLLSHEIIHVYQYYDYNFVNSFMNKKYSKWSEKSKTFKKIKSIFYFDLNGVVLRPLYLIENANRDCYFDNFFEAEAEFFATGNNLFCID